MYNEHIFFPAAWSRGAPQEFHGHSSYVNDAVFTSDGARHAAPRSPSPPAPLFFSSLTLM